MEQAYCFYQRDAVGTRAQKRVMDFLMQYPQTVTIQDVSADPIYRAKDVDFIWRYKHLDDIVLDAGVEVKGDERMVSTGNFFLETVSNDNKNTPGWLLYSEACFLAYVSMPENLLYMMMMQELRKGVLDNRSNFREVSTSTQGAYGNILYRTKGLLVPKGILKIMMKDYMQELVLPPEK